MSDNKTPFERIGGRAMLQKVTKIFYDKVDKHPWIGQYFAEIPQEYIENQQVDFMQGALRGGRTFSGRMPADAHMHMVISDELFDLRNQLLSEALQEAGVPEDLQIIWLGVDEAFRSVIVKGEDRAEKRFKMDEILNFPKKGRVA